MKCDICKKDIDGNKKSFTNHFRWCSGKMSADSYRGINWGEKNGKWKGNSIQSMPGFHLRMRRRIEKPLKYVSSNEKKPFDLANISQEYKPDVSDWEWLCRKCHMIKDGRIYNLKQFKNKGGEKYYE